MPPPLRRILPFPPAALLGALLLVFPPVGPAAPTDDAMAPEEADEGEGGAPAAPEPARETPVDPCADGECPLTAADWIFYRYGTDCAGMDWRFLRSAAKAESGLDPRKRDGKRAGLFQLDPESCSKNIAPFPFLDCSRPEDAEANTAAAVNRFHRFYTGRRDLAAKADSPGILDSCPGAGPEEGAVLAYVGLKLGPGVLRHLLKAKACKDAQARKSLAAFYEGPLKPRRERALAKYEEARQAAAGLGAPDRLYPQGPLKTTRCPAAAGKRLLAPVELEKALSDGTFKDKPLVDPQALAAAASGSRLGEDWEKAVSERLGRMRPGWEAREGPGGVPQGGALGNPQGGGAENGAQPAPGSQLPKGLRVFPQPPPPLGAPAPAPRDLPKVAYEPVQTKPAGLKLTGPKEQKDYNFRGQTADALAWTALYDDGTTFAIIAPKGPDPQLVYHTVQQAADAARYLPKSSRAVVETMVINQAVNPDDEHWAKKYKKPGFHSYMTAGEEGIVTIYPNKKGSLLPGDASIRSALVHETGHTWSYRTWGTDTGKGKWVQWKKAGNDDKTWVSEYAKSSIAEDIAETYQVYNSALGGPRFKEHAARVPNRFAMLAKEIK